MLECKACGREHDGAHGEMCSAECRTLYGFGEQDAEVTSPAVLIEQILLRFIAVCPPGSRLELRPALLTIEQLGPPTPEQQTMAGVLTTQTGIAVSLQPFGMANHRDAAARKEGEPMDTATEIGDIPAYVIRGLALVRQTGAVNMMDRRSVIDVLVQFEEDAAADWCRAHKGEYMAALQAIGAAEEG